MSKEYISFKGYKYGETINLVNSAHFDEKY